MARLRPGKIVLVVGASGGVGTGAIAVARLAGWISCGVLTPDDCTSSNHAHVGKIAVKVA